MRYFEFDLHTKYCGCDGVQLVIVDDDVDNDYISSIGEEYAYDNYEEYCEPDEESGIEGDDYYFESKELTYEEFGELCRDYDVDDLSSK